MHVLSSLGFCSPFCPLSYDSDHGNIHAWVLVRGIFCPNFCYWQFSLVSSWRPCNCCPLPLDGDASAVFPQLVRSVIDTGTDSDRRFPAPLAFFSTVHNILKAIQGTSGFLGVLHWSVLSRFVPTVASSFSSGERKISRVRLVTIKART